MAGHRSEFLGTVAARGFIHQCTDDAGLDEMLAGPAPQPF